MAQRYGCLPSHLMKDGDSFDLMVFDVAHNYEGIQQAKANKQPLTEQQYNRMYGENNIETMKEKYYGHKSNT